MLIKKIQRRFITTPYGLFGADFIVFLFFTPFLISSLGQSEYGVYSLMGALVGSLAVLDRNFSNAVTKHIIIHRTDNRQNKEIDFISKYLVINGTIALICLATGFLLFPFLSLMFGIGLTSEELVTAKTIYIISLISVSISFVSSPFYSYVRGYEKYKCINAITFIRLILKVGLLSILFLLGFKAITVVAIDALLNLCTGMFFLIFSLKKLNIKIKLVKFDIQFLKHLTSHSLSMFLGSIVNLFYWRIGLLILGSSLGSVAVAVYSIGILLVNYYQYFSEGIYNKVFPTIEKMVITESSGEELTKYCSKIGRLQFFLLGGILLGFLLFGKEFIILWLGFDYEASYWISLVLLVLRVKRRERLRTTLQLSTLILGVILGLILNSFYGIIGMAVGIAIAVIVLNWIIINFLYVKVFNFNFFLFLKQLVKIIPSMCVSLLLSLPLYFWSFQSWGTFLCKCILFLMIYVSFFWIMGANHSEKVFLKSLIRKNVYAVKKMIA